MRGWWCQSLIPVSWESLYTGDDDPGNTLSHTPAGRDSSEQCEPWCRPERDLIHCSQELAQTVVCPDLDPWPPEEEAGQCQSLQW